MLLIAPLWAKLWQVNRKSLTNQNLPATLPNRNLTVPGLSPLAVNRIGDR
ncbi:hypothetical protein [Nostoc sp. C117]